MKTIRINYILLPFCVAFSATASTPFAETIVKQAVNQVEIVDPQTLEADKADVGDVLKAPEMIRTGRKSRAQLEAPDGTITRVGSNTIFSFDDADRTIRLQQGNVLLNSPKGKGGAKIVTATASATVLGTTLAVSTTSNGGFKCMCLEGQVKVQFPGGGSQTLNAGQMTFVMPSAKRGPRGRQGGDQGEGSDEEGDDGAGENGGDQGEGAPPEGDVPPGEPAGEPGPVLDFDLDASVEGSSLMNGFEGELPSAGLVQQEAQTQQEQIASGAFVETGVVIVEAASETELVVVDASTVLDVNDNNPEASSADTSSGIPVEVTNAMAADVIITAVANVPGVNLFNGAVEFSAKDIFGDRFSPDDLEDLSNETDRLIYGEKKAYYGILGKDVTIKGVYNSIDDDSSISLDTFSDPDDPSQVLIIADKVLIIDPAKATGSNDSPQIFRIEAGNNDEVHVAADSVDLSGWVPDDAGGKILELKFNTGTVAYFGLYVVKELEIEGITIRFNQNGVKGIIEIYGEGNNTDPNDKKALTFTNVEIYGSLDEVDDDDATVRLDSEGGEISLEGAIDWDGSFVTYSTIIQGYGIQIGESDSGDVTLTDLKLEATHRVGLRSAGTLTLQTVDDTYGWSKVSGVTTSTTPVEEFSARAKVINLTKLNVYAESVNFNDLYTPEGQSQQIHYDDSEINLDRVNFIGATSAINISARTVSVENVHFGNTDVNLRSANGIAKFLSTGATPVPMYVNFIGGGNKFGPSGYETYLTAANYTPDTDVNSPGGQFTATNGTDTRTLRVDPR